MSREALMEVVAATTGEAPSRPRRFVPIPAMKSVLRRLALVLLLAAPAVAIAGELAGSSDPTCCDSPGCCPSCDHCPDR